MLLVSVSVLVVCLSCSGDSVSSCMSSSIVKIGSEADAEGSSAAGSLAGAAGGGGGTTEGLEVL